MRVRAAVLHEPGTPVLVEEVELAGPGERDTVRSLIQQAKLAPAVP
jgi:Zn-dependent alcohol dehydrogenase